MADSEATKHKKQCEDCDENELFHRVTYSTIVVDEFIASIFKPSEKPSSMAKLEASLQKWLGPFFFSSTAVIGLAHKQLTPDDGTLLLARCLWEDADRRGIDMWEWRLFGLARNMLMAKLPNGKTIAFEGIPSASYEHERVHWMDDKSRLKTEFQKRGLPVARGGAARTEKEALTVYRSIKPPVIIKPHSGSGSRHTILHIKDEKELLRAFRIAKQVSPKVVIEEELVGPVYRATVVDGTFQAALRRDPPSVVGDGTHTLIQLVEKENEKPGRSGPYFSKVQLTDAAEKELEWQGYTFDSVPPKGKRVYFHQKVNWSLGGTTADVTDLVHIDNVELFERAARELRAPIAGIDFIIGDISRSWKYQERCGILECNSMPFFDNHHLPFEGEPRNVAGAIWDMILSEE